MTDTTTTDASGHYQFSELAGTYKVTVSTPAGYVPTVTGRGTTATDSNPNGSTTTLANGQSDTTIDFGFYQPVTIGNFVWNDANADGVQDAGSSGMAGVTLTLHGTDGAGNAVTDTTTTDAGGHYQFTEPPGTYTVAVSTPVGYVPTLTGQGTPATDSNVSPSGTTPGTLASGGSDETVDFGFYRPVTIGDFVWHDAKGTGVQDGTETGIADVGLTLTGTTAGGTAVTAFAMTDANGEYLFTEPPGTYTVSIDATNYNAGAPLDGYQATAVGKGGDAELDSNASPSGTTPAALAEGQNDTSVDFGFVKPVTIGHFVWKDLNGNGVKDRGELGIAGVTLTLTGTDAAGDAVSATTKTDSTGYYQFTELPGSYQVAVTTPTGYVPTVTGQDSKPSPSGTTPGTLTAGGTDQTLNFGFQPQGCVAGAISVLPWTFDSDKRIVITFLDSNGLGTVQALRLVHCTMEGLAYDVNGNLLGDFPNLSDVTPTALPANTVKVVCLASLISGFTTGSCNAQVQDVCGTSAKTVDPVTTRLQIASGGQAQQVLTGIQAMERLVSVRNGTPGMTNLTLVVNGQSFVLAPLSDGASVSVDVGAAMVPGDANTIILIGEGPVGASAAITIGDGPAGDPKIAVQSVALQIAISAQGVQLSWSGSASGYVLQSRSSLGSSGTWVNWPIAPQSVNGSYVVTMPAKDAGQFFRLIKP